MKRRQISVWIRYAASYLLVLALPFLSFSVFFNQYIREASNDQLAETIGRSMDQIQETFDSYVSQMGTLAGLASQRKEFNGRLLKQNFNNITEIRKTLVAYVNMNRFCSDILFYSRSAADTIITALGTYNPSYYYLVVEEGQEPLPFDQFDWAHMKARWFSSGQLQNGRAAVQGSVLYAFPVDVDGWMFFLLDRSYLEKSLFANLPENSQAFIFYQDRQLYPYEKDRPLADVFADDETIEALSDDPFQRPVLLKNGLYLRASDSSSTGLRYYFTMPEEPLSGALKSAMGRYLPLSLAIGLLCIAGLCLASLRHAKPIQEMVNMTGLSANPHYSVKQLPQMVENLRSRSQELDATRRHGLQEHALIRLIRGRYASDEAAEQNLNALDMRFEQPWHCIALLAQEGGRTNTADELLAMVSDQLTSCFEAYGFAYADKGCAVFLLGMPTEERASLKVRLTALVEALPGCRFSIGQSFQRWHEASDSFLQALTAINGSGEESVVLFERWDNALFYPANEMEALREALQNADREKVALMYDVLNHMIISSQKQPFLAKSIASDMINAYLHALSRLNPQYALNRMWYVESIGEHDLGDLDRMQQYAYELHQQALQWMAAKPLSDARTDMNGVASYITACEDLESLTVGAVAERFGMTISALSHRFKEQMNCNISDYILARKMAYACLMLRTTDVTVADIAARIGYTQYTSFVRQFKNQKDMTPSAYRETYHKRA
ncbi:MAG: helix-turn-helix domain-containing protein [Eubacteriales bacterium]|nr:helix-turn-helix domain-containing protein [Eubacteriales bacterium]